MDLSQGKTKDDQAANVVSNIVVESLRISAEMLENNSQSTLKFAEVSTLFCAFHYYLLICYAARNGFGYG